MIAWISQWLREIIIVVMLAIFVDLLLPSKALKRYVKVVLSLFILMAIISPLASLFKANLDFDSWDSEVSEAQNFQSLQSVLEAGAKFRANNEQQVLQHVEAQIATQMKHELDIALPGQVNKVKIAAKLEDEALKVERVNVVLNTSPVDERHPDVHESDPLVIDPIEPIVINLEMNHINEERVLKHSETMAASAAQSKADENDESMAAIANFLLHNWHVSSKQLVFSYADEVSSLYEQEVDMWAR